jgi:tRNA nucleotidyltransferase/poly(A) polymerase
MDAGIRRLRYFYSVVILSMLSAQKLKVKILKDRYNSIIFKKSRGREVYLVGGYIRDILRGKISKDKDFIVSDDIKVFVKEVKKVIGGTLVEFQKGETTRLVLKDGVTLDFTRPMGTLYEDLSKRDFTINAIAWSPENGIIDPYNGLKDIQERIIRALGKENFLADPLRMLRAYRFAAELNGSIEDKTRRSIKTLCNNINKVSPERITFELFNLLNSENPGKYLNIALNDRLLSSILPINKRLLGPNLKAIYRFTRKLKDHPKEVKVLLEEIFSQNITYKGLLFLELLLRRNGMLETDSIPLLRISRNIVKRIILAHNGMKEFKRGKLFNFFMKSKEAAIDIIILRDRMDILKEYIRFKSIWKRGVISSLEVARIGKIKAGPTLGRIIVEMKKAEFDRKIKSKKDAHDLLFIKRDSMKSQFRQNDKP